MTETVITTKRDLAAYLREHDPLVLEFLQELAKAFGPAEMVAYVKHGEQAKHGEINGKNPQR